MDAKTMSYAVAETWEARGGADGRLPAQLVGDHLIAPNRLAASTCVRRELYFKE